jgi:hypothetical protein
MRAKSVTLKIKEIFLDAYKKSFGNVTVAAKAAKIERTTYYLWRRTDPEFVKAIEEIEPDEIFVDFVENALQKKIEKGDTTAIIFALKCKGKKRGYIERQEMQVVEGSTIVIKQGGNKNGNS